MRIKAMRTTGMGLGLLGAGGLMAAMLAAPGLWAAGPGGSDDPALSRTRAQVRMLDALYKNAVVSATNRYNGQPAIKMAKDVFAAMEKGGWHRARLVDASGSPMDEANRPRTEFEKRAEAIIRSGRPYYDEVETRGDARTLLAATVVPAVLKKCADCHGVKEGALLGFIRYEVPVE